MSKHSLIIYIVNTLNGFNFFGIIGWERVRHVVCLPFEELDRTIVTIDIGEEAIYDANLANKKYSTLLIIKSRSVIVDAEPIATQISAIYLPGPVNAGTWPQLSHMAYRLCLAN